MLLAMLSTPSILTEALVALDLCKAGFVLMMSDLVPAYSNLVALVADNWLVCANISMSGKFSLVDSFSTVIRTCNFCSLAVGLNVRLKLVNRDVCLATAIGAIESRSLNYVLDDEM